MVIAWSINVSCELHPYFFQWTRSTLGPRLPKRIRNTHPRNYYYLKGKDIYIYIYIYVYFSFLRRGIVLSLQMDVCNRHRESKSTKLYEIGSVTKLFITFEFKVIRQKRETQRLLKVIKLKVIRQERETQSFYADCFYIVSSQPNQRAAPVAHKVVWPRPTLKVNLLLLRRELNSQISAHASGAWRHSNTLVSFPIWDFYFDISEWHILTACAWTPALILQLTNPCTE